MDPTQWEAPLALVVAALFVIVMARANATYWLGRALAAGTARSRWSGVLRTAAYRRGAAWLNRWGAPAVTLCFLTVGVQTMVNLAAGATRMSLTRYLPAVAVGSLIWALVYGTVGFVGFVAVARLWASHPLLAALLAAALVGTVLALLLWRRRPAGSTE